MPGKRIDLKQDFETDGLSSRQDRAAVCASRIRSFSNPSWNASAFVLAGAAEKTTEQVATMALAACALDFHRVRVWATVG